MMAAFEGVMARLRRVGGWIRRHPVKTAAALPLAVLLYVAALYPFTPSIGDIRKSKQESPSVVLSADGKELAVFRRANRDWVKLQEISPKAVEALLATEDRRFYDHIGIDFIRTGKAMLNTLQGDVEGGSTITQQLARNLYPEEVGREQTITRKVKEAITALKIEAIYSKDEILETYLNSVSFLYNARGIEMAARTYFDKPAKDLNELEAATLIGMLKGTSYYNPVINPERALDRRNTVLAMMKEEGRIDAARYEKLKAQPMKLDFERLQEVTGPAPHLTEYLRRWLNEWADRNDYNIYSDGLVVRTTIDSRLQAMANQAVERQMKQLQAVADVEWSRSGIPALGSDPAAYAEARKRYKAFEHFWNSNPKLVKAWVRESGKYKELRDQGVDADEALKQLEEDDAFMADLRKQKTLLQTGFLAMDPTSGAVKAWVGSRDYAEDKFDHVQQARRQPGSTFKPFVYGAAFESGMRPTDTFMDGPVEIRIDRNQVWRPTDIDGMSNAPMTLREGLARSKNTITAQLMMQVGPSRVASLARKMGVRESKLQEVPSLALGTSPVTLKEMVTSFSTIANGGNYIEPQIVTSVEDRNGNVLETFHTKSEGAMSTEAAQTLLDVMRGVVETGTAVGLKPRFGVSGDLAGKTGTTQDNTDGWFILMHPQLVAGAWVGFNDNRVTMRSSYWGQGSHNALLVVGDFTAQAQKANVISTKATFAAPRLKEVEQPVMDRMGDWWNSVFSTEPAPAAETAAVAMPETPVQQPELLPPPAPPQSSLELPSPPALEAPRPLPPARPEAPMTATLPERIPAFPRALEPAPARPAATIPDTQVYRAPEAAPRPDPVQPPDVVRAPSGSGSSATSTLGGAGRSGGTGTRLEPVAPRSEPVAPRSETRPRQTLTVPIYDGASSSSPSSTPGTGERRVQTVPIYDGSSAAPDNAVGGGAPATASGEATGSAYQ
ncbi:MAG: penicillin-binding protein 1A [Ramlibacter sp.]